MPPCRPLASGARFIGKHWYHGWTVVAAGLLCSALSSPGQSFALALYVDPLIEATGLSRVGLSAIYGVCTLVAAACLPFTGRLADETPSRIFLPGVLLMLAVAMAALASVRGVVLLVVAFVLLRLLGQGAIALGTTTATVRWFSRYRGRALAIVGLGYAVGEATFPGALQALIDAVGWRGSLIVTAIVYAVVFVPLVALAARERDPRTEPLDGEAFDASALAARTGARGEPARCYTVREALRTPVFYATLAATAIMPMVLTGVFFHQVAVFDRTGWGAALVPTAFFAYAITGVAANLATGFVLEHADARWGLVVSAVAATAALGSINAGLAPLAGALVYGSLIGVAGGIASTTNSIIWPAYFGVASLGAIKGVVNGVRNGATALGPPVVAAVLIAGSPLVAIGVIATLLAIPAVLALTVVRPPGGQLDHPPADFGDSLSHDVAA